MAQPIKWWVTIKSVVCWHVCHPAVICHVCASRCSIKHVFCRCHYTTCLVAWSYCGLVHTVQSSSHDTFLLLFLWVPLFLWTFFLLCCTSPFFPGCCHLSSLTLLWFWRHLMFCFCFFSWDCNVNRCFYIHKYPSVTEKYFPNMVGALSTVWLTDRWESYGLFKMIYVTVVV